MECERAIKLNFIGRTYFLTFTADGTAFGDRAADFLIHLKQKRALGHALRLLRRWGWIGASFRVAEFQGNGMIHYHVIVDAIQGWIPKHVLMECWNRQTFRPAWAGEPGVFEGEGKLQGQTRPLIGFVDWESPKGCLRRDGRWLSATVRYICGYLSKAGKNPHPQYFEDYCDGKIDGRRHNAVMKSSSRDFFEGVRLKKVRRSPATSRGPYKRKSMRERLNGCGVRVNLLCRVEQHVQGEIVSCRYEYLGTFDHHGWLHPGLAAVLKRQRGYWLNAVDEMWVFNVGVQMNGYRGERRKRRRPGCVARSSCSSEVESEPVRHGGPQNDPGS